MAVRDRDGNRIVTVFGGTGFVGSRIVKHLHEREFSVRIASRHPDRARALFGEEEPRLQPTMTDICELARGPDADRHTKLLINREAEGSLLEAYLHLWLRRSPR
jgi:nucleoside-diphosphate-sugar epimerase